MSNIVVVGDVILDTFVRGYYEKIGAEAIPVIKVEERKDYLGGAANVAANIKSMGHDVFLLGHIADDDAGYKVREILHEKGINNRLEDCRKTIHKSRINQLLRFDDEEIEEQKYIDLLREAAVQNPDYIVVSDYGKGTITQQFYNRLKKLDAKLLVDPKHLDYSGAYLLTPNRKEAMRMTGKNDLEKMADKLKIQAENVLITRGREGMSLFTNERIDIPTEAKDVYEVTGAGDIVIATIATQLAEGKTLEQAVRLANKGAGVGVSHHGQYEVTREDLK